MRISACFFTPKSFFRRVTPALLTSYFATHKVLEDFSWNRQWTKYQFIEALDEAYHEIPEAKRAKIEDELRDAYNLSNDDAQETLRAVCQTFNLIWDDEMIPEDRVLRVLLENKDAFDTACDWSNLENYQGFTDYLGPSSLKPKPWTKIEKTFCNHFNHFFKNSNCGHSQVDHYEDNERQGHLVTYESRLQNTPRFDKNGKLIIKPERPVLESLMIYYPKLGKLKVKTRSKGMARFICGTFAKVALDKPDFFEKGPDNPVYNFDRFKKLGLLAPSSFDLDPADGIESVKVTTLYFNPDATTKDTVTVHSTKDLAERTRTLGIDLSVAVMRRVHLRIKFSGKGRGRTKTVRLSLPNNNNLGDSKRDRVIERCLRDWNIETTDLSRP